MIFFFDKSMILKLSSGAAFLTVVPTSSYYLYESVSGSKEEEAAPVVNSEENLVTETEEVSVEETPEVTEEPAQETPPVEAKVVESVAQEKVEESTTIDKKPERRPLTNWEWLQASRANWERSKAKKQDNYAWTVGDNWNICSGGGTLGKRVLCVATPRKSSNPS